ncbi:MAG TPA: hypothetical protein VGN72_15370 [Tepidisphaeraceae bacterium]|jgi:hypothetical protein|nr:hypothetical protein [Tepidisphaeraceae bacterium]
MASLIAITSGAADGGLLALCLFGVAPVALFVHLLVRRFVFVSLVISLVFGLFLLGLWLYFDAGVPGRRWVSFRLVWVGFIIAMVVSAIAGIPTLLVGAFGGPRRRDKQPLQRTGDEGKL